MCSRKTWLAAWLLLAFASYVGCGDGGSGESVKGTITLDGQPLAGAGVSFISPTAPPGRAEGIFFGVTDDQGHYSLQSAKAVVMKPGKYRVAITTTYVPGGAPDYAPPPPERVPLKYRNGTLEFDVPEGGTDAANFDMKSK